MAKSGKARKLSTSDAFERLLGKKAAKRLRRLAAQVADSVGDTKRKAKDAGKDKKHKKDSKDKDRKSKSKKGKNKKDKDNGDMVAAAVLQPVRTTSRVQRPAPKTADRSARRAKETDGSRATS